MEIQVHVVFPSHSKKERLLNLASDTLVSAATRYVLKKFKSSLESQSSQSESAWGLYVPARQLWMSPSHTNLGLTILPPLALQTLIELRARQAPLKVFTADGAVKTHVVDRSQPVRLVTQEIGYKMRLGPLSETYGLKAALDDATKVSPMPDSDSDFPSFGEWLLQEQCMDAQNVSLAIGVYFGKRFVDLTPTADISNAVDDHLTFCEARWEFLQGKHDASLFPELQIELAAILLLHTVGRHDAKGLSPSYVTDNSENVISPRWRKKLKSDVVARIATTHAALSALPWTSDPKQVKHQFIQSMLKLSSFASRSFSVDTFRLSNGVNYTHSTLTISSAKISIRSKKSNASSNNFSAEKDSGHAFDIPLASVARHWVAKNLFCVTFTSGNDQLTGAAVSDDAVVMNEDMTGYIAAAALRPILTNLGSSAEAGVNTNVSHTRSVEYMDAHSMTIEDAASQAQNIFLAVQEELLSLVLLQPSSADKKAKRKSSGGDLVAQLDIKSISELFTQAATHLASVSRGIATIEKKYRSGNFFHETEVAQSVGVLRMWATAVECTGRCIIDSARQSLSGIQTIAEMTLNLISLCSSFMSVIASAEDVRGHSKPSWVHIAERVLSSACSAVDLALRGRLADEASTLSLQICCRDIEASSAEMILEASGVASTGSAFDAEIRRTQTTFSWYTRLLHICSAVIVSDDSVLSSKLRACLDGIGFTANSLLAAVMERSDTDNSPKDPELATRLRFSWACLDQSLKVFAAVSASSEVPITEVDPMLPPAINYLVSSIENLVCTSNLHSVFKARSPVDCVVGAAYSLVRTLAKLITLEYSPLIVSHSAKLEACVEKLHASTSRSDHNTVHSPNQSRRSVASAALATLDAAVFTVSDLRRDISEPANRCRAELRLLMMQLLFLRSSVRLAASFKSTVSKYVDNSVAQQLLEKLDVLIHNILPTHSFLIMHLYADDTSVASGLGSLLDEWESQFRSILEAIDNNPTPFSVFSSLFRALRQRVGNQFTTCKGCVLEPTDSETNSSSAEEMPIKRSRSSAPQDKLRTHANAMVLSKSLDSMSFNNTRGRSASIMSPPVLSAPLFQKGAINEAGLLFALEALIASGESKELGMPFKDALEFCLITFPYWSTPEVVTAQIVAPYPRSRVLAVAFAVTSLNMSLLSYSIVRYGQTPQREAQTEINVGIRVSVSLSRFLRLHPHAVQDPGTRMSINSAISVFKTSGTALDDAARAVSDTLRECVEAISSFEKLKEEQLSATRSDFAQKIDLLNADITLLAEQLTLVEQLFFEAVNVADLVNSAYSKGDNALTLWIEHSNAISRWIASRILQTPTKKDRARLILRLIKLAETLQKMSNYSSAITIFLSLSMECIARLKKTWDHGAGALLSNFARLSESIRPMQNFGGYREDMKRAQAPCIPYIAVLMRDIVNMEEILQDIDDEDDASPPAGRARPDAPAPSPLFNFSHLETVFRVLHAQFSRFKKAKFQFERDPKMFFELMHPIVFDLIPEDDLLAETQRLEPEKRNLSRLVSVLAIDVSSVKRAGSGSSDQRATPSYGIRSKLSADSSPALLSPRTERSSISKTATAVPWKEHLTMCAAALEAATIGLSSNGKLKFAQAALEISAAISSCVQATDSPQSPRHTPSKGSPKPDRHVSIFSYLHLEDVLLHNIPELNCDWNLASSSDDSKRLGVSNQTAVQLHAICLQYILAMIKIMSNGKSRVSGSSKCTITSTESEHQATFCYTVSCPSQLEDPESTEAAILELICPSSNAQFVGYRGRLQVRKSCDAAQLTFSVPLFNSVN